MMTNIIQLYNIYILKLLLYKNLLKFVKYRRIKPLILLPLFHIKGKTVLDLHSVYIYSEPDIYSVYAHFWKKIL